MEKYIINFSVEGEYIFLENKKELILFRIVQEAINNFLKHAESDIIDIKLQFHNRYVSLEIKDYGKGFYLSDHLNNLEYNSGAGIKNIIKRAGIIGGQIEIQSKINEGTLIKVEVPYETEKD
jgi:signal transduction histidine kinase